MPEGMSWETRAPRLGCLGSAPSTTTSLVWNRCGCAIPLWPALGYRIVSCLLPTTASCLCSTEAADTRACCGVKRVLAPASQVCVRVDGEKASRKRPWVKPVSGRAPWHADPPLSFYSSLTPPLSWLLTSLPLPGG